MESRDANTNLDQSGCKQELMAKFRVPPRNSGDLSDFMG